MIGFGAGCGAAHPDSSGRKIKYTAIGAFCAVNLPFKILGDMLEREISISVTQRSTRKK